MKSGRHFRGGILITRVAFIKEKYGLESGIKIHKELIKMGYKVPDLSKKDPSKWNLNKIKLAEWYPNEYNIAGLKIFKKLYGEKAFIRMSKNVPFENEGFIKHFVKWPDNPDALFSYADKLWHLFYDFGRLEAKLIDKRDGEILGYDISDDPIFCEFLTYYFEGLIEHIVNSKVNITHTECTFRGSNREKWEVKW